MPRILIALIALSTLFYPGSADITDMIGEAICAAQCLTNFTQSLDEPERTFLNQRPDLTEPHCLSKRSNCSLCLEVCRWPRQNVSSCAAACNQLEDTVLQMLPNSPMDVHRRTCLEACVFSHNNRVEREAIVSGTRPASCPLPSSWPETSTCQPHQHCITDADCGFSTLAKCCRFDACLPDPQTGQPQPPPVPSMLYRLARGGGGSAGLQRPSPPTGFCMRVNNDTAFAYRGVPPVPGRPVVRQTALVSGEPEVYQLELDWPDYYNMSQSADAPEWLSPAVFLVQVRLFRDLGGSLFGDKGEFGDDILQDELFSDWRSLVWTTKLGAVLSDLSPGTWYQFRLKAASSAGYGGNGRPSRPVKVMTLPDPPRNLTESSSRIYSNKVEVKIHWEPPTYGNVPIKFYRVSWKKNVPSTIDDRSLGEFETKIPKKVFTYTLQDLEPATVYKVDVTAVAIVDGKEWSSAPTTKFIKTVALPKNEYPRGGQSFYTNADERNCRCGESPENSNLIQPVFFEGGILKAQLTISRQFLLQYFGPGVKDTTIFHVNWFPQVCIETQNSKMGGSSAPSAINVYTAALAGLDLKDLRFQCHYKLRVRMADDPLQMSPQSPLELCFCTPSCTEVVVKSGPGPRNCSFADILIPHRPVDVGYRLFPTEPNQRHLVVSGGNVVSSQSEMEPVFPVRNYFKRGSNQALGFDAVIFWKPHPEMVIAPGDGSGRYTKYAEQPGRPFPETRRQSRGYRIIWGPRLVEPIEPDMYSNGIAPQLDPERTESKVVDSKVHNVILRNLEPDTLYIVQVQTIGVHGDSPVNAVFFTTPSLRSYSDTDASSSLRGNWMLCLSLGSLCIYFFYCVLPR